MIKILLFLIIFLLILFFLQRKKTYIEKAQDNVEKNNIPGALNDYLLSSQKENIEALFSAAIFYRFDEHLKNQQKARLIYLFIIKNGNSQQIARAKMFLEDLNQEIRVEMKEKRNNDLIDRNRKIYLTRLGRREKVINKPPPIIRGFDYDLERAILENLRDNLVNNLNRPIPQLETQQRIFNDKQNVHESLVVRSTKDGVNKIDSNGYQIVENMRDLETILRQKNNPKIIKTFEKIMGNTENLVAFDKKEIDILNDVWNRIQDPINDDRKNDMTEILCQQLADGSEVCSMGRVARVLQTLENTDRTNDIKIRPEWAIKEEISNLTAKIYENYLNTLPTDLKQIAGTPEDELSDGDRGRFNDLKKNYENTVRDRLHNDYNGLLSKEYLETEVEKALSAI